MPYYIFALGTDQPPHCLAGAGTYGEAKAILAALREAAAKSDARPDGAFLRMIFAADEQAAVQLLTQPRAADASLDAEDD
jgi:hypothetical protein